MENDNNNDKIKSGLSSNCLVTSQRQTFRETGKNTEISNKNNPKFKRLTCEEKWKAINLQTLVEWKERWDLIVVYKLIKSMEDVDSRYLNVLSDRGSRIIREQEQTEEE